MMACIWRRVFRPEFKWENHKQWFSITYSSIPWLSMSWSQNQVLSRYGICISQITWLSRFSLTSLDPLNQCPPSKDSVIEKRWERVDSLIWMLEAKAKSIEIKEFTLLSRFSVLNFVEIWMKTIERDMRRHLHTAIPYWFQAHFIVLKSVNCAQHFKCSASFHLSTPVLSEQATRC